MANNFTKLIIFTLLTEKIFCLPINVHEDYKNLKSLSPYNVVSFFNDNSAIKIKEFIDNNRYKTIVEIGSCLGASTIYIGSNISVKGKIYAIDCWSNVDNIYKKIDILKEIPSIYSQFLSNIIHCHLHRKVIPIDMSPSQASKKLNVSPDLVYITSTADQEQLNEYVNEWYQKLNENGIICGENWNNSNTQVAIQQCSILNKIKLYYNGNFWWFAPKPKDEKIDKILKNNIILCTGPSYGRKQLLIDTTEKDMMLIPFKKIFVATHDKNNLDVIFNNQKPSYKYYQLRGKQLDCLNCIINSIKLATDDPECRDDDIIIFKHESVYINDMSLIKKAIRKLLDGYDMVVRNWTGFEELSDLMQRSGIINSYYMTNVFFIKVSAARSVFKNISELTQLTNDFHFCEEYFTKFIVNKLPKVHSIDYFHSTWKDNELGFFHIPRHEEEACCYWNKENYDELY